MRGGFSVWVSSSEALFYSASESSTAAEHVTAAGERARMGEGWVMGKAQDLTVDWLRFADLECRTSIRGKLVRASVHQFRKRAWA